MLFFKLLENICLKSLLPGVQSLGENRKKAQYLTAISFFLLQTGLGSVSHSYNSRMFMQRKNDSDWLEPSYAKMNNSFPTFVFPVPLLSLLPSCISHLKWRKCEYINKLFSITKLLKICLNSVLGI